MVRHEWELEEGEDEVVWENIVMDELEKDGGPREEWLRKEGQDWASRDKSWAAEPGKAKERVKFLLWDDMDRTKRLGERMIEAVDKEKKLWSQERCWRKHAKNDARRERKRVEEAEEQHGSPAAGKDDDTVLYVTYKPQ